MGSPESSSPELSEVETGRPSYVLTDRLTSAVNSILRAEKPSQETRLVGALEIGLQIVVHRWGDDMFASAEQFREGGHTIAPYAMPARAGKKLRVPSCSEVSDSSGGTQQIDFTEQLAVATKQECLVSEFRFFLHRGISLGMFQRHRIGISQSLERRRLGGRLPGAKVRGYRRIPAVQASAEPLEIDSGAWGLLLCIERE